MFYGNLNVLQSLMVMELITSAFKKTFKPSFLDKLTPSMTTPELLQASLIHFREKSFQNKQLTLTQLNSKFKHLSNPAYILPLLLFFLEILPQQPLALTMSLKFPSFSTEVNGKKKAEIAQAQLLEYFIKFTTWKIQYYTLKFDIASDVIQQWIQMALSSLKIIQQFIKIQFVVAYLMNHQPLNIPKSLLTLIVKPILQATEKILQFLSIFLKKYTKIILKRTQQSFAVNQIYEKTIAFQHNLPKLCSIAKGLQIQSNFVSYQIDKELNAEIEKEMYSRREERLQLKQKGDVYGVVYIRKKVELQGQTMCRLNDI